MATTIRRIEKSVQKIAKTAGISAEEAALAADVVVGISRTRSCHLSQIARALGEAEPLIVTERRLSEALADDESALDDLQDGYLREVAGAARRMPFVVVDPTEIAKPYGRAFEHLDTVRDASDRRKNLESGYWCVRIEATDEANHTLPLYTEVFSTKAPEYAGWNETFWNAMEDVIEHVGRDATWVFDRAFDGLEHMRKFEELALTWLIRQQQNRNIQLPNGVGYSMDKFAFWLNKPHETLIPYVDKSTHELKHFPVHFGFAPIRLPGLDADIYLIAVQRPNRDLLVLLTNRRPRGVKEAAALVRAYMRRWGVEDGIRFWKQATNVEDFRVRNWNSIRRLAVLSAIATGIQALWLIRRPSLAARYIARVKVFIEHVLFQNYRLWDGVADALLAEA
jgi:hypothetical protein